ncbi:hypothetical protein SCACP_17810 [Sporomusa carbonis]|uniref:hypothetical protein n=1 Tax=Sporomusa carbonis TaxID=3076075 RepID=UPI003A69A4E7
MGLFTELRNECLIKELQHELNTDVLLFGFDGFTYFGCLQNIDDCRIAVLTPAMEAETSNVEILTTGGELHEVNFARVDLWQIVAKGTCIKNDPIEYSHKGNSAVTLAAVDAGNSDRQESHDLICLLKRMIGEEVVITTLGGFLFEGVLSDVEDELAILKVDDIFVPGTSSSISGDDVRSVVVNLEALTSVSKGFNCCK